MAEKINQIEINGTVYDLQDKDAKSPFTGTTAQVEAAIANGDIKEGDIVNITDDVTEKIDVLESYEEIMANTDLDKIAGATGVKEGFTEINDSLSKCELGEQINITSYNSATNVYTCPCDGYIFSVVEANKIVDIYANGINFASAKSYNTTGYGYGAVYVRKNMRIHLVCNSTNTKVYFIPFV